MKKIILATILILLFSAGVREASSQTYFTASLDILNNPTFGFHEDQYAPATLRLVFYAYSYTDKSPFTFKFDCTSDGTYEAQVTLVDYYAQQNYSYPVIYIGNGYTVQGGKYWRYVQPNSGSPAWWGQDTSGNRAQCTYSREGDYTLTMVVEQSGHQSVVTRSFNVRPPVIDTNARPFYQARVIEDVYPQSDMESGRGGVSYMNIPKPTAPIDIGLAIWNPLQYETYWWFPLKPSPGTISFDCEGDGTYEKNNSFSVTSLELKNRYCAYETPYGGPTSGCINNVRSNIAYYPGICVYDKPGVYQLKIKSDFGSGITRETYANVPVVSSNPATVSFSTGSDPKQASAPLKGVDLKLDVANVVWANTSYNFDCGNGQATSKSINTDFSKRYYDQDYSTVVKDYCNYDNPGEYTVKAQAEFRTVNFPGGFDLIRNTLPSGGGTAVYFNGVYSGGGGDFKLTGIASNYLTYTVAKQFKVLVTGKVSDTEYVVTSPFDLKWDALRVTSCSAVEVGNSFSASGGGTKSISISNPPGDYSYKLTCTSSSGVRVEKVIKVKVIAP